MALLISLILALIPIVGVLYIVVFGSLTSVDGLFMTLILLSISGVLVLNVLIELRKGRSAFLPSGRLMVMRNGVALNGGDRVITRGRVQDVVFFESNVGQPNKSIITLSDGGASARTLALEGDLRNALPVGQTVEITLRKESGRNVLVDVIYA
jgi:hypothetical protein